MMIGFYMRLSMADGDLGKDEKEESNSIENQRLLLQGFVESRKDISGEITEYIDDGYTGTNFDRPAFKQMIEDAKKGKIDTIIVKDLSRLGRDYIGAGDYLEQIFPVLGIRFIAVNSSYDSNDYIGKTIGLDVSISNLLNSLYSKDLSKKYTSAIRTKWKQGISTCGRLPFGYKKDDTDKSKWMIDEEAAKYVRIVFEKAIEGWNTSSIANHMNEIHAPTPGKYKQDHFDNYEQWNRVVSDNEWLWDTYMVWRIIKCYSYTGALVHGTTKRLRVGGKAKRTVPQKDQVIVDGVHPAIVTVDEWETAQTAIRSTSKRALPQKTNFPLTGKVRCGNCGCSMPYSDRGTPSLCCLHRQGVGKHSKCDSTVYEAKEIIGIVSHALRTKVALFRNINTVLQEQKENEHNPVQDRLREIKMEIETLKARRIHLYEAYAEGIITKDKYLSDKEELTELIERVEKEQKTLIRSVEEEDALLAGVKRISDDSDEINASRELTVQIANTYIDRVVIYDPKHMEIIFTFEDLLQQAAERVRSILEQKGTGVEA